MKAMGYSVDVNASDVLMVYITDGSVDLDLRWLRFMGSSAIRTDNFIIRQLFESCMKNGLYEQAKSLLETYVNSAAKVDLVLYTSILAHLVRCQDENNERHLMSILSATRQGSHFHVNLSVGAALVAVVHKLHRFRKRMLYYGVVPRRIKLVTGPTLKIMVTDVKLGGIALRVYSTTDSRCFFPKLQCSHQIVELKLLQLSMRGIQHRKNQLNQRSAPPGAVGVLLAITCLSRLTELPESLIEQMQQSGEFFLQAPVNVDTHFVCFTCVDGAVSHIKLTTVK
ncbi:hypothetical protein RND71_042691 [Anisodus tanguticus]|uniref:Pentatricopeptide repeat-containing protein n=1 Tax=Anisodus tanguticus TaxID=243964 RepID=A0AAE1QQP1_9SOLA|nr:hypothetical protein RND71_042691 [Anisodus tanguticus]